MSTAELPLGAAVLEWARAERASWPAPRDPLELSRSGSVGLASSSGEPPSAAPPPPPCGNSCASCGFALCPLCKEDARALLDCAVKGEWPTIRAALDERPELLNYAPEAGEVPGGSERATHALLHFAARTGDEALVAALLALPGCQPRLQTRDGRTASAVAQAGEHWKCAALLRAAERAAMPAARREVHTTTARAAYVAPVVHSASAAAERWAYGAAERAAAAAAAVAAPSVPRRGAPYADWMPR